MSRAIVTLALVACAAPTSTPPPSSPPQAGIPTEPNPHLGFPPVVPPFVRGPHPVESDVVPNPPPPPPKKPPRRRRNPGCEYKPICPHRGGDDWHNWCADTVPPNDEPGCDVLVRGKLYDAIDPFGRLHEIKTERWSEFTPWLRGRLLADHVNEAKFEHLIATSCGYPFVFAVADRELYLALSAQGALAAIDIRHIPECDRNLRPKP